MNTQEREIFWKTLCELTGEDLKHDVEKLIATIKYPKYLYRYRPVSMASLEALRTNKLYFSSANYYDDPFDTFLHIDIEYLRITFLTAFQTLESTEAVVTGVKNIFGEILSDEQKAFITVENITKVLPDITDNFLNTMLSLRSEIKKDTWSVCFSESGFNETLWLKYADQYKGFVQFYDFEDSDSLLCGKQEKCKNCGISKYGTPLFPIYYSDDSYDATRFAGIVMLNNLREQTGVQLPQYLYNGMGNGLWERERITLIKRKCHEYDEEWRMITACRMEAPIMREWIPNGIILGLRMDKKEENLVIRMAREAGIKNIYKSIIDSKNQLNAIPVKFE